MGVDSRPTPRLAICCVRSLLSNARRCGGRDLAECLFAAGDDALDNESDRRCARRFRREPKGLISILAGCLEGTQGPRRPNGIVCDVEHSAPLVRPESEPGRPEEHRIVFRTAVDGTPRSPNEASTETTAWCLIRYQSHLMDRGLGARSCCK